jgi:hypothetical protein
MSKSIPFLTRPEKLDGSMPGDMGFDPMGLSEIQSNVVIIDIDIDTSLLLCRSREKPCPHTSQIITLLL